MKGWRTLARWAGGTSAVALLLALVDPNAGGLDGFWAYAGMSALCAALLAGGWLWLGRPAASRELGAALAVAVALRLIVAFGLPHLLPAYGNPEEHHRAGYFLPDAWARDRHAWNLQRSGQPLWIALSEPARSDQYGGLLFLGALAYRAFSPEEHRPVLPAMPGLAVSALGVLFAWHFANLFGRRAARLAAWVMALHPEALLLTAGLMREPYLITAVAATFAGYAGARQHGLRAGLPMALVGIGLTVWISPPYAVLLLGLAGLAWIWEGRGAPRASIWVLSGIGALALVMIVVTARAWVGSGAASGSSPIEVIGRWLTDGARYELSKQFTASGWVQEIFRQTPEWAWFPLATLNGLVQPFLPATLLDRTVIPLMRLILIARALGWFVLLPFLLYAPLAAFGRAGWRSLPAFLSLAVWGTAILAAYRLAGDQWDSVRARTVFLALQAALAGWAWSWALARRSPWLGRMAILVGGPTLVFMHWYAGRYYQTPKLSLWGTLAASGAFVGLCLAWWGARAAWGKRRLTERSPGV